MPSIDIYWAWTGKLCCLFRLPNSTKLYVYKKKILSKYETPIDTANPFQYLPVEIILFFFSSLFDTRKNKKQKTNLKYQLSFEWFSWIIRSNFHDYLGGFASHFLIDYNSRECLVFDMIAYSKTGNSKYWWLPFVVITIDPYGQSESWKRNFRLQNKNVFSKSMKRVNAKPTVNCFVYGLSIDAFKLIIMVILL